MKMQRLIGGWCVVVAALLLAGCAGLMTKPERPEVSVASITLVEPGLLEQRYRLQLRVQNPNNFDLPIDGMQMRLELNSQPFVTAVSAAPVTVPRYGSALVEIDAISTLAGLLQQFKGIAAGNTETVNYKLAGKVHLAQPAIELPFTQEGEINLSGLLGNTVR
jgi:LEA14-like dessication related protein